MYSKLSRDVRFLKRYAIAVTTAASRDVLPG